MIDVILRVPDETILENRTALKKAVAALFGDRHDGERSNYLFSPEPLLDAGPWVRVRVVDGIVPSSATPFVSVLDCPVPVAGDKVIATAWVALKSKVMVGAGSAAPRIAARLDRARSLFENAIEIEDYEVGERYEIARIERGRERFARAFNRVRVTGRIKDAEAAQTLLSTGIGASKAYGFGLVDMQIERGE
ncbi:MAG: type I-E CRISPR-associated protein Cas6/Cse3/CasE [Tabrizicola sp.]|nr:type I-E CRISPR-associated protein Cas6/Cse3/CasE [Tabrizicola sp.]